MHNSRSGEHAHSHKKDALTLSYVHNVATRSINQAIVPSKLLQLRTYEV